MGFICSDWRRVSAAALVAALLLALAPNMAYADDMGGGGFAVPSQQYEPTQQCGDAQSMRSHFGYGIAAVVGSLFYGPVKSAFALTGLLAGGVAYAFTVGDTATARSVAGPALEGDYVLTPCHMMGDTPVEFIGKGPF